MLTRNCEKVRIISLYLIILIFFLSQNSVHILQFWLYIFVDFCDIKRYVLSVMETGFDTHFLMEINTNVFLTIHLKYVQFPV